MEVQAHGNYFEDVKTREITGFSKDEYDKLKNNGYTSSMDIVKGLHSDKDISIKTAKGRKVDCGDILRRRAELEYDIIIGQIKDNNGRLRKFSSSRVQGTTFAMQKSIFYAINGFGEWTDSWCEAHIGETAFCSASK